MGYSTEFHCQVCNLALDSGANIFRSKDPEVFRYIRKNDCILVPTCPGNDGDPDSWHLTLLHELVRWTGTPKRLNRPSGYFVVLEPQTDEIRLREEVTDELGALLLAKNLGLKHFPARHRYRSHVLEGLKIGAGALEDCRRDAIRAAEFLATP